MPWGNVRCPVLWLCCFGASCVAGASRFLSGRHSLPRRAQAPAEGPGAMAGGGECAPGSEAPLVCHAYRRTPSGGWTWAVFSTSLTAMAVASSTSGAFEAPPHGCGQVDSRCWGHSGGLAVHSLACNPGAPCREFVSSGRRAKITRGQVAPHEGGGGLQGGCWQVNDAALRVLFDDVDADHSGSVEVEEFIAFIGKTEPWPWASLGAIDRMPHQAGPRPHTRPAHGRGAPFPAVARCRDSAHSGGVPQPGHHPSSTGVALGQAGHRAIGRGTGA